GCPRILARASIRRLLWRGWTEGGATRASRSRTCPWKEQEADPSGLLRVRSRRTDVALSRPRDHEPPRPREPRSRRHRAAPLRGLPRRRPRRAPRDRPPGIAVDLLRSESPPRRGGVRRTRG